MPPLTLVALWALSWFQAETIRIPARIGTDEVTFDPSRVSALDVRRWIQLSPIVGGDNGYLIPENIELCYSNDPRYEGCGKEQEGVNVHNAQLNIDKIQKRIRTLDTYHYPADLEKVVSYVRSIQSFGLWRNTQLIAFERRGDLSVLESPLGGINPKLSCGPVLDRIAKAKSHSEASHIARFDWSNCVTEAQREKIGEYPRDEWEKFLADHAIREHYIQEDITD